MEMSRVGRWWSGGLEGVEWRFGGREVGFPVDHFDMGRVG